MSHYVSPQAKPELLERIENLFYGTEYYHVPLDEWFGDDVDREDVDGKEPLIVWARELLARDLLYGLEVIGTDRLALLRLASGQLAMERFFSVETEDDDEETVDYFSLNMYTGEIYYEDHEKCETAVQEFENRFKILEDL